jgi:predicted transcriptional regulator
MAWEKIEVHVPTELMEFARKLIDGQDFVCVDDVIVEALYRFVPVIDTQRRQQEWLKAEVQKGIDAANRGELVEGSKFMDELIASLRTPAEQAP